MEDQDYIVFENYLSEMLSDAEKEAFEIRLLEDAEFKTSFEGYKEATDFLKQKFERESETVAFQQNLEKVSNSYFDRPAKKAKTFTILKYAVAASVALLIGVFLFNRNTTPSYEDLITYDTLSLTVRGEDSDAKLKAEEAFNTKNFKEAERYLDTLLKTDPKNNELLLYKGLSMLEQDKFEGAIVLFKKVAAGTSVFKDKAEWYMALAHLKEGNLKACMQAVQKIPETSGYYPQAHELLEALE